jgi:DNA polymerase-3 subunit gamma/tau
MKTLAVKYRPTTFDDVTEQSAIVDILSEQIETETHKNCYLFCGPAGCGKTTLARIFTDAVNKGEGSPIEIDAASNNGIEQVREIISSASFKALDSKYKVYIIDECHALSNSAWQAMLKLIEEPPVGAIFIFCTTDAHKIPATILSRVQRYDFAKISHDGIVVRLKKILKNEKIKGAEEEALRYIATMADGGMRDAISLMDKALAYKSKSKLTMDNTLIALGTLNYDSFKELTDSVINKKSEDVSEKIEEIYAAGTDLHVFIKQYLEYVLDGCKWGQGVDEKYIRTPRAKKYFDEYPDSAFDVLFDLLKMLVALQAEIRFYTSPRVVICSRFYLFAEGVRE